ncbi:AbrB/MazE/SpoVT family DNA-binding domain-containing protein [Thermodesulfatator atlanticus]|uniref:AbrB/MazE/SpoVT family DNA-binding domain-containing protein n=1 Tax=Thermodesulfatator atlanticus TaxID=501497 RepID=UPI0003B5FAA8|nr:AbrB/MazE/SpoVT family DNA-binding domain-containing protein [Thermodesulfatator atlanticus]
MEALAKITSKGQVTIPKKMRELLGTNVVRFRVEKGKIILEPVRDVGGIFKKYVKKPLYHEKEREIAWQKVADEYRDLP